MKRLLLSVGTGCMGSFLCAQVPADSVQLKAIEVVAPRLSATAPGAKLLVVDSATLSRYSTSDLGQLLANESPVFVKSYGLGSLATTSFRGGSANHTAVLWNGFSISSAMNGQLDLSLVPVQLANSVAVHYGSSTALWGSGAVGGAILLNDLPRFGDGTRVHAGLTIGSFGDRRQQVRVQQATDKWVLGLGAFNATAENDFPLTDASSDAPEQRQRNAAFAQHGLLADAHVILGTRHRVGMNAWYQDTDRRIPPTAQQATSTARQLDESLRLTVDWQRTGERATTSARIGWFDEELAWHASDDADVALSRSRTVITEVETRVRLAARHHVHVGLNNTYAQALSDGYPEEPDQNRSAVFAAYRFSSADGRSQATFAARQEVLDGNVVPFTWSAGGQHAVRRWLLLKAQVAKVYRVPTFNDLYWQPGGNPDLLSEDGYSGDLGALLDLRWKGMTISSEVTWFNRLLDNWITWSPGPAYWSPRNLMQVWSRGVETNTTVGFPVGQLGVKVGVLTNYVLSTNQVATSVNDASVDKQLIYVPMYSGHAKLDIAYKRLSLTGLVSYTGYRYTSTDNSAYLEPYTLADAWVAYRLPSLKGFTLDLRAQCNNVLATTYEVMMDRPMPLRSYQAGVSVEFHRPLHRTP